MYEFTVTGRSSRGVWSVNIKSPEPVDTSFLERMCELASGYTVNGEATKPYDPIVFLGLTEEIIE